MLRMSNDKFLNHAIFSRCTCAVGCEVSAMVLSIIVPRGPELGQQLKK